MDQNYRTRPIHLGLIRLCTNGGETSKLWLPGRGKRSAAVGEEGTAEQDRPAQGVRTAKAGGVQMELYKIINIRGLMLLSLKK